MPRLQGHKAALREPCPDAEALCAFAEDRLSGGARNAIAEHLKYCAECRDISGRLSGFRAAAGACGTCGVDWRGEAAGELDGWSFARGWKPRERGGATGSPKPRRLVELVSVAQTYVGSWRVCGSSCARRDRCLPNAPSRRAKSALTGRSNPTCGADRADGPAPVAAGRDADCTGDDETRAPTGCTASIESRECAGGCAEHAGALDGAECVTAFFDSTAGSSCTGASAAGLAAFVRQGFCRCHYAGNQEGARR